MDVDILRSKLEHLVGYTDIRPHWVEVTPYRERLWELVEEIEEEFNRLFPIQSSSRDE